ncbi:AhpC-TSA-domain-containing protein [Lepidopterella palustris CBS 459.81]|uniref:thioredoxin-dependent peroxiredoxin n=1 Tax=Lepidopterella palustris CBS 459.81 TaxID=1314670 RepID=A0A8E2EGL6_9PEZI|nr:AhpC-TSA-domain-containing protein [Lepidopterella palustris CBS 459.81]
MVELRKRKTPPPAPVRPAKKKAGAKPAASKVSKTKAAVAAKVEEAKEAVTGGTNGETKAAPAAGAPSVDATIDLSSFGGEIETNDGTRTTLAKLVEESKAGVVLFTYPRASTPGCTKQACLFRDGYDQLTGTGLSIFGLSSDSPKLNTTFKTKQNLPYTLLCDPSQTLIKAIGMHRAPKGTKRGVFVVDKAGKVLVAEEGGPQSTVDAVKKIVGSESATEAAAEAKEKEDTEVAKTADEVADTAEALDGENA